MTVPVTLSLVDQEEKKMGFAINMFKYLYTFLWKFLVFEVFKNGFLRVPQWLVVNFLKLLKRDLSNVKIDDLPDELLVKILSYSTCTELIETTQNVCSRWRRLSQDPQVWQDKEFCIEKLQADVEVETILRQARHLRSLVMKCAVEDSVFDIICNNCPHLTTLSIAPLQQMSNSILEQLVEKCPDIRALTVPYRVLDEEPKAHTLARLHQLQSLNISPHPGKPKPIYFSPLADGCPDLKKLEVSEGISVSTEDMEYFINVAGRALTHLQLPWTTRNSGCIVPMLKSCTSLIYLQLNYCTLNYDEALEAFTALSELSTLHTLIVKRCPAPGFEIAMSSGGFPHLHVLQLSNSDDVDDDAVTAVCKCCTELKELNLKDCHHLTDDGLKHLNCLIKLETLDLSGCRALGGEAVPHVARVTTLRKLLIGDIDLKQLVPGLERLTDITSLEFLSLGSESYHEYVFPYEKIVGSLVNLRTLEVLAEIQDFDWSPLQKLQKQMPGLEIAVITKYYSINEDYEAEPGEEDNI